ncbi:MAG TPA: spore germination protein [Ruminococcaceae bacterium]|nr:spore germination protein [Oscillospiraceae bacterium]
MFKSLKAKIEHIFNTKAYLQPENLEKLDEKLSDSLLDNLVKIRELCDNSADLLIKEVKVNNLDIAIIFCEGMINTETYSDILIEPLMNLNLKVPTKENLLKWIRSYSVLTHDQKEFYTFEELYSFMMSGFAVVLIDGFNIGIAFGMQGFNFRSISEPSSEMNIKGSREGFVEALRVNMSMIRRRVKSPVLKFELLTIGIKSKTSAALVYLTDSVSPEILRKIRYKLSKVNIDMVLDTGYLQPYLEERPLSIFSGVGITERPDTLCAKISEGRVAVLLDGTPFALIVPYLFSEHFQSLDDYCHRPYYALFIRTIKYISFFLTILLPGWYVAAASFHPETLPNSLLFNLAASQESTPFPLMLEALIIHFIYELMHEAGLRLPRPVGHAVSIVGALVVGDAAVKAGIISSPMIMIVAVTAISSFVVPSLYEPIIALRFYFIIIGGLLGLFGISLSLCVLLVNLCAISPLGIPGTSPSSPFTLFGMRDVVFRLGWRQMGKKNLIIQDLPGSDSQKTK